MDTKTHYRIQAALRNVFRFSPALREARKRAQVGNQIYLCAGCDQAICTRPMGPTTQEIEAFHANGTTLMQCKVYVDHIEPVIDPVIGFKDWTTYVERLFCSVDNLQVMCHTCHYFKSQVENQGRKKRSKKDAK